MTQQYDNRYCLHSGWFKLIYTRAKVMGLELDKLASFRDVQPNVRGEYDIRPLRALHTEIITQRKDFLFTIQAPQHITPFTFGCFSVALSTCPSLYDCLKITSENLLYIAPQAQFSVKETSDSVVLRVLTNDNANSSKVSKLGQIMLICTVLEIMRDLNDGNPVPVSLSAPDLNYRDYEKEYFSNRYNCISLEKRNIIQLIFNKDDLLNPSSNYNEEVHELNLNHVRKRVMNLSKHDIRLQICGVLEQYESLNKVTINSVAYQLLTSTRTLNRRLASFDTNFKTVLNNYRLSKAIKLLDNPEISMTEITYRLGFSELSSFSRAFKSWTGDCPTKLRKSQ